MKNTVGKNILCALIAALTLNVSATPPANAQNDATAELKVAFDEFKKNAGKNSQAFALVSQMYLTVDRNGDGISKEEIDAAQILQEARSRAKSASQLLAFDLDADFVVTADEIVTVSGSKTRFDGPADEAQKANMDRQSKALLKKYMVNDADNSNSLAGKELYASSGETGNARASRNGEFIATNLARAMLKADPNTNGVLTVSEGLGLMAIVTKETP